MKNRVVVKQSDSKTKKNTPQHVDSIIVLPFFFARGVPEIFDASRRFREWPRGRGQLPLWSRPPFFFSSREYAKKWCRRKSGAQWCCSKPRNRGSWSWSSMLSFSMCLLRTSCLRTQGAFHFPAQILLIALRSKTVKPQRRYFWLPSNPKQQTQKEDTFNCQAIQNSKTRKKILLIARQFKIESERSPQRRAEKQEKGRRTRLTERKKQIVAKRLKPGALARTT